MAETPAKKKGANRVARHRANKKKRAKYMRAYRTNMSSPASSSLASASAAKRPRREAGDQPTPVKSPFVPPFGQSRSVFAAGIDRSMERRAVGRAATRSGLAANTALLAELEFVERDEEQEYRSYCKRRLELDEEVDENQPPTATLKSPPKGGPATRRMIKAKRPGVEMQVDTPNTPLAVSFMTPTNTPSVGVSMPGSGFKYAGTTHVFDFLGNSKKPTKKNRRSFG
jgi:hypothetical protein